MTAATQGKKPIFEIHGRTYQLTETPYSLWLSMQILEDQLKQIPNMAKVGKIKGFGKKEMREMFKGFWEESLSEYVVVLDEKGNLKHLKVNEIQPQDIAKIAEKTFEWYRNIILESFLEQREQQQSKDKSSKATEKSTESKPLVKS